MSLRGKVLPFCDIILSMTTKGLTVKKIVDGLKKAGFATKSDIKVIVGEEISKRNLTSEEYLNKTVTEAIDAVLDGVQRMFDEQDEKLEKKFVKKEDKYPLVS